MRNSVESIAAGLVLGVVGMLAGIWTPGPQQAGAAESDPEADRAALKRDLQIVRSQIELYKIQHLDKDPSGAPGVGLDGEKFIQQLINKTDQRGVIGAGDLGPYLDRFPKNPFVDGGKGDKLKIVIGPCPGDGTTGWYFDVKTGKLSPNDPENKGM